MKTRVRCCLRVSAAIVLAHLTFAMSVQSAHAYSTWSGCADCHGSFAEGTYVSSTDGTSWGDNLMDGHSAFMGSGTCNVCHQPPSGTPRGQVFIGLSAGISGYSPISCLGCHGRAADASPSSCVSATPGTIDTANCGMGTGLRLHHANAGVEECADCHTDGAPVGENNLPPYYFAPDSAHPNKPVNACNTAVMPGNEDKYGLYGLDNDGDDVYDQDDADCEVAQACGDGITSAEEDCDDGDTIWTQGEYCDAGCAALACGDTNNSGSITSADALFALRAAVKTKVCDLAVCDVNKNGSVGASDALAILRKAVGGTLSLVCPAPI
jgi:hypothetical protein